MYPSESSIHPYLVPEGNCDERIVGGGEIDETKTTIMFIKIQRTRGSRKIVVAKNYNFEKSAKWYYE
ncbi:hypothetical protein Lal_00022171 [Lupinus albus]|nr:hypothetical protein Lal_00022171 [Lupinus albus]